MSHQVRPSRAMEATSRAPSSRASLTMSRAGRPTRSGCPTPCSALSAATGAAPPPSSRSPARPGERQRLRRRWRLPTAGPARLRTSGGHRLRLRRCGAPARGLRSALHGRLRVGRYLGVERVSQHLSPCQVRRCRRLEAGLVADTDDTEATQYRSRGLAHSSPQPPRSFRVPRPRPVPKPGIVGIV